MGRTDEIIAEAGRLAEAGRTTEAEIAYVRATETGDLAAIVAFGYFLLGRGRVVHAEREFTRVIEAGERRGLAHLFRRGGDSDDLSVADAWQGLARIANDRREPHVAIELLTKAMTTYRARDDHAGIADVELELAMIDGRRDRRSARQRYETVLDLYEEQGFDLTLAGIRAQMGLGSMDLDEGRWEAGIEAYRWALDEAISISDRVLQAEAHLGLGRGLASLPELEEAADSYGEALSIYSDLNDEIGIATAQTGLADIERMRERYDAAAELLEKALTIYLPRDDQPGIASTYVDLANVEGDRGNLERAEMFYRDALTIFERLDEQLYVAIVYENLADLLAGRGSVETAVDLASRSAELYESLDMGEKAQAVRDLIEEWPIQ